MCQVYRDVMQLMTKMYLFYKKRSRNNTNLVPVQSVVQKTSHKNTNNLKLSSKDKSTKAATTHIQQHAETTVQLN